MKRRRGQSRTIQALKSISSKFGRKDFNKLSFVYCFSNSLWRLFSEQIASACAAASTLEVINTIGSDSFIAIGVVHVIRHAFIGLKTEQPLFFLTPQITDLVIPFHTTPRRLPIGMMTEHFSLKSWSLKVQQSNAKSIIMPRRARAVPMCKPRKLTSPLRLKSLPPS